jgi:hypothetical protein
MTLHFLAKFIKNQYITEIEIDGDFVEKSLVQYNFPQDNMLVTVSFKPSFISIPWEGSVFTWIWPITIGQQLLIFINNMVGDSSPNFLKKTKFTY